MENNNEYPQNTIMYIADEGKFTAYLKDENCYLPGDKQVPECGLKVYFDRESALIYKNH